MYSNKSFSEVLELQNSNISPTELTLMHLFLKPCGGQYYGGSRP